MTATLPAYRRRGRRGQRVAHPAPEAEGYAVTRAFDGPGAVEAFTADPPDVVLPDIMLPRLRRPEVCRRIQAIRPCRCSLTARDDETDIPHRARGGSRRLRDHSFACKRGRRARPGPAPARRAGRRVRCPADRDRPRRRRPHGEPQCGATVQGSEIHLTPLEFDLPGSSLRPPGGSSNATSCSATWGGPMPRHAQPSTPTSRPCAKIGADPHRPRRRYAEARP